MDTLTESQSFVDLTGNGYQTRTAWAGEGTGVLMIDADHDGKISNEKEFAFTKWDESAESDLAAVKSVFDSNHNGKLDAGDARWADFKVSVNGQLVTLASLGITSIDLTPGGSGQSFADGSAITGTAAYTRSNGTIGMVGDAVLASEGTSHIVTQSVASGANGATVTTISGYDTDGSLAFRNAVTKSADGRHRATQYDDDGNGAFDRSQSDDLTINANGSRTRVVDGFNDNCNVTPSLFFEKGIRNNV